MPSPAEVWASLFADVAAALIVLAAFLASRLANRRRAVVLAGGGVAAIVALAWVVGQASAGSVSLVDLDGRRAAGPALAYAALALLSLAAVVGFGLRFRRHGGELDRWLALALTLVVFADLHYVLTASPYLLYNDFLRLLAYALLLVGVWQAYGHAEFGRAVAEERARVARDIHDGLAQYLFAISAHVSMLEAEPTWTRRCPGSGRRPTRRSRRRNAVLALSSASGTRSTPRSAATSSCSLATGGWTSSSTSTRPYGSRPTSRSRSSGSCRRPAERATTRRCRSRM